MLSLKWKRRIKATIISLVALAPMSLAVTQLDNGGFFGNGETRSDQNLSGFEEWVKDYQGKLATAPNVHVRVVTSDGKLFEGVADRVLVEDLVQSHGEYRSNLRPGSMKPFHLSIVPRKEKDEKTGKIVQRNSNLPKKSKTVHVYIQHADGSWRMAYMSRDAANQLPIKQTKGAKELTIPGLVKSRFALRREYQRWLDEKARQGVSAGAITAADLNKYISGFRVELKRDNDANETGRVHLFGLIHRDCAATISFHGVEVGKGKDEDTKVCRIRIQKDGISRNTCSVEKTRRCGTSLGSKECISVHALTEHITANGITDTCEIKLGSEIPGTDPADGTRYLDQDFPSGALTYKSVKTLQEEARLAQYEALCMDVQNGDVTAMRELESKFEDLLRASEVSIQDLRDTVAAIQAKKFDREFRSRIENADAIAELLKIRREIQRYVRHNRGIDLSDKKKELYGLLAERESEIRVPAAQSLLNDALNSAATGNYMEYSTAWHKAYKEGSELAEFVNRIRPFHPHAAKPAEDLVNDYRSALFNGGMHGRYMKGYYEQQKKTLRDVQQYYNQFYNNGNPQAQIIQGPSF